jgi:hypothetical protein
VTLAGTIGGSASSATWSGGDGTFNPGNLTLNATYTPTAAEITAGEVTLTLTTNDPANACGAVTDEMKITIYPPATVNAGIDQTVCASNPTITLAGVVGGAAGSGVWSGGTTSGFNPNRNSLTAVYTPSAAETAAGIVNLTLTTNDPAGPCGTVTDDIQIVINPIAVANAGPDQTVCASNPDVTLAGSVGGGAFSGTWSGGAGTFSPDNTTLNAVYTPSAYEISAGTVTLTLTTDDPTGPCGGVSDQVTITINQVATVNANADQTVCASSPAVTLAGAVAGAAISGTWSSSGTGTFSPNNTTLNAVYTPSAAEITAGTATLTLTTDDPNGPCSAVSDEMVITINVAPTVNAGPDQTICSSDISVTLAGQVGGAAGTGTWSGGAGNFTPNATALNTTYTPTANEIAAGFVILTLTTEDPNGPCNAVSDQMRIDISPAATVSAGSDQTICSNSTATMDGAFGGGATSAVWSTDGTGTFNNNAGNAIYTPSAADITDGAVLITYTTIDPDGAGGPCTSVNALITLTINPAATISAGADQTICSGTTATMAGTFGGGAPSAVWSTTGDGSFSNNNPTAVYTPGPNDTLSGNVTLTYTSNAPAAPCLVVQDALVLNITREVHITTQPANIVVCATSPAQLGVAAQGAIASYKWYKVSTPDVAVGTNSNLLNFASATPSEAGAILCGGQGHFTLR